MTRLAVLLLAGGLLAFPVLAAEDAKPAEKSGLKSVKLVETPAPPKPVKATRAEREAAMRLDPLGRAAFFNREFVNDPTDIEAGLALSEAQRALGNPKEAADTAHRVLLFAPQNYEALLAAARGHIANNDAFYAIDPLQTATTLKPNDWRAWSLLGVAYDQTKRSEEALTMWDKALSLSPDNPAVLTNQAMYKAGNGDLAQAETILRRAVTLPGATIQVRQNLALVLGMQGKLAEAEKLLRQDLPPDVADKNLAWLQASLKPAGSATPARDWNSLKGG
jgi:Flp pilus assembly protein TadD